MKVLHQLGWLSLALFLGWAAPGWAQAPPGPLPPRPGAPIESAPPGPKNAPPPIHLRVDLVSLPVTVTNPGGDMVVDLGKNDFRVFDNGIEQKLDHFDLGGDPLAIAIVLETSSRVEPLLPAIRQTGILFTQTVMGQTADAAVIGFDDSINVLQPFTFDSDQVQKTINKLPEGTSGARLYDALARAVALLGNQPPSRRRVIVTVAESTDTGSESRLGEVLRAAQLANVAIYTVGLSTTAAEFRAKPSEAGPPQVGPPGTFPMPSIPGTPQTPTTQAQAQGVGDLMAAVIWLVKTAANSVGPNSLDLASTATGGLHLKTFRDRSIETAIDRIGGELHAQYTLAYTPAGTQQFGYHEIKVEIARSDLKVRTRPGYYLAPPAS